jgi:hypothetical protein
VDDLRQALIALERDRARSPAMRHGAARAATAIRPDTGPFHLLEILRAAAEQKASILSPWYATSP